MIAKDRDSSVRLSTAGREALEEHLDAERRRILAEATRLGDGTALSAFDIVNAVELITAREREAPVRGYRRTSLERWKTWSALAFVAVGLLGVVAIVIPILLNIPDKGVGSAEPWLQAAVSVAAGAATAAVGFAAVALAGGARRANRYAREMNDIEVTPLYGDRSTHSHAIEVDPALRQSWIIRTQSQRATGAFIASWILLEEQLRELGGDFLGIPPEDARRYPFGELLRRLQREGVLAPTDYQTLRELLALRNAVMHGGDYDPSSLERADAAIPQLRDRIKLRAR
ncbi:hypothetical protein [Microbacterium sp. MYb64]|uniref:hypothetical protein n=1 Tax=Microbacterium sp. MYb64 TaxID=1848691 RepID=UPI0011B0E621|nr:hypothetical protein [Microbacterium sp. MYb64]